MSHKTNKFYKILSSPLFYSLFQKLMKGDKIRRKILTNAIKKKKTKNFGYWLWFRRQFRAR